MDHVDNEERTTDTRVADSWDIDRGYLLRVAARVLHDDADAEDVVQEAFGRLARVNVDEIEDLRGWLAVVVRLPVAGQEHADPGTPRVK